ncbi:hypothetical protein [Paraoerskovia marina]|uniref:hypothetical protein n=1 Tax=Paraoerskovia marina TaxID=545619 RepID=UPI0009F527C1|nr:hypothetical protein [Paraoerskovia marina]
MVRDDGPSRVGDVRERLGRDSNYVTVYRNRLIEAGVIEPAGYGLVTFSLPSMRDHLRQHAAHQHSPWG